LGQLSFTGRCPLCEGAVTFHSEYDWFRDHLQCDGCQELYAGSVVRERAIYRAFKLFGIRPEKMDVHEVAPGGRGASIKLLNTAKSYVGTNYFPDRPAGEIIEGLRCENSEAQTFADESFDLVVHLDVMEHVNHPDRAMKEFTRTLRPGGWCVFSAPTYKDIVQSRRAALYLPDGRIEHYEEPEYHGNPISDAGSLLTWRYGYDFVTLLRDWSGMDVTCLRFADAQHGLLGEFTEVYVCRKPAR
jgi:SAM-dependent methyltransferase